MFQVTFTLPYEQHNGKSNIKHIQAIELEIAKVYGGYTSSNVDGAWFDKVSGHLYEDRSRVVSTLVETQDDVDALLKRAETWAEQLQQIALLVTVGETVSHFVKGTREQAVA